MNWRNPANRSRPSNSRTGCPPCGTTSRSPGNITNSAPVIARSWTLTGLLLLSSCCSWGLRPQVEWSDWSSGWRAVDGLTLTTSCRYD